MGKGVVIVFVFPVLRYHGFFLRMGWLGVRFLELIENGVTRVFRLPLAQFFPFILDPR